MTQSSLFPADNRVGLHHRGASDTELAAATGVAPRSGTQRFTVLAALVRSKTGLTDWQLTDRTGILRSAVCARRNELVRDRLVEDSGRRRIEKTGLRAIVWHVTDAGREAMYQ